MLDEDRHTHRQPLHIDRSDLIGAAVAGVAAGGTGAVIGLAARHVTDVGDLLGFIGAAVGAILTVGAAAWIESNKRRKDEERRLSAVRQPFAALHKAVSELPFTTGNDVRPAAAVIMAYAEPVKIVRDLHPPTTVQLALAFNSVQMALSAFDRRVEEAIKTALYFRDGRNTLQEKLEWACEPLRVGCRQALENLS